MELILWRHAEAEDAYPDMTRKLTKKGHEQAEKMASWLKSHLPKDTRILVSPATRTQQTAEALALPFETLTCLAPGASAHEILEVAQWSTAQHSVLIVGHQPTLGIAAALAITRKPHYWSVKKGAVWWLTKRVRAEEEQAIIRAVIAPDLL